MHGNWEFNSHYLAVSDGSSRQIGWELGYLPYFYTGRDTGRGTKINWENVIETISFRVLEGFIIIYDN